MGLKIWNIGKANARIDELESQLATARQELAELKTAAETNDSDAVKGAEQLAAQLAESKALVETMAAGLNKAERTIMDQTGQIKALEEKLAAKEAEVKVTVARQVLDVQAALGQPAAPSPAQTTATASPGGTPGISRVIAAAKEDLAKAGYKQPGS